MTAGIFSWRRLHVRGGKKQTTVEKPFEKLTENQSATKSDETPTESSRRVVATKTDYAMATVKEVLALSQSAAGIMPVPFLHEAIGVALKVIETCEEASAVEQKVKELQIRVADLMIIIVDNVTPKDEEDGKDVVMKTAKSIEADIKELLSTLETINGDLRKISAQNGWVIAIYKELNMNTIESCIKRLSIAMENFTLANDLRDSALISELHGRLLKMSNKVDDMHTKVEDIHKYLIRSKQSATEDAVIRQEVPLKPEVFYGRDDLVEDIVRLLLQEETSRVCILGPGGMGKTSVSLAVIESPLIKERFPGNSLVWVPCIEATSATLLLEILYVQLQIAGDKHVTLEKIISELETQKQSRLILLDNFETPWNGNQTQVSDIIRKLASLSHIALFVTMRGKYPPSDKAIKWQSRDIESTDEAACLRIYHDINPGAENDPDVPRLLAALGHMPFAVTLMAKLGMEGQSSAQDLLEAWFESGPDILSNEPEQSMNRSISLSVESDLVRRNPNAITLLAILSLLPAGTTKENLRWWAPTLKASMIPSAIATLSQAALLVENKRENSAAPILFVIPVVQSFMQQQDRIAEEIRTSTYSSCCDYVLAHASRFDDPAFPKNSKVLAAEDTNIQSMLFGSLTSQDTTPSKKTMEALIAFNWHRCDTNTSLEIANYVLTAAKASGVVRYIASALWCLGQTYAQFGDHNDTSCEHLQEAYRLFNSLPPADFESQRLGSLCGIDLVDVVRMRLWDTDNVISLARDIEAKCATLSDDLVHGRSLVVLGVVLHHAEQSREALRHLDHARTMLRAVGSTPSLAYACQGIFWVLYVEGRFSEALDAIEEGWKHAKLTDNASIQSDISLDMGRILFNTNRDTEAWEYLELSLMKANTRNRFRLGQALEHMGYGYLRRGDYQNAYGAYEAAAENYLGTVEAHVAERCKGNLARIHRKQENPDMIIGFYRPALDVDETLLYPPVQMSAGDTAPSAKRRATYYL